jgi:rod shape-determining protein MreD
MTLPLQATRSAAPPGAASATAGSSRVSQLSSVASGSMHPARYIGVLVLLLVVLLLQRTVLARLDVPFGTPDLLAIVVAAVALQTGPALGSITGFLAGFGADLLSDHALGRLAAVLCVVGYLLGLLRQDAERSVAVPLIGVAVGCVVAALLFAGTGVLVDDTRAGGSLLIQRCLAAVLYSVIVTPFLYPLIGRILGTARRERR